MPAVTTTPASIISSLESLIIALTPSGGTTVGTQAAYAVLEEMSYSEDAEQVAESDIDRQFVIQGFAPQEVNFTARRSESTNQIVSSFEVAIGHQVTSDYGAGRDRRDKDIVQIITQLINAGNMPTGVGAIRYKGLSSAVTKQGQFFWSVLTFEVVYFASANYGG